MSYLDRDARDEKIKSGIGVVLVNAALLTAVLAMPGIEVPQRIVESLTVIDVTPELPPPPPVIEEAEPTPEPEGAAAPPALRADPSPYVAPRSPIPLPPRVDAAPVAGTGSESEAGASDIDGPGTGAGGVGAGTGSGGSGSGTGGGVAIVPAEKISGEITNRDFRNLPDSLKTEGYVSMSLLVGASGRVTQCTVTNGSGNAALDAQTCAWIRERFRYRPATIGGVATTARKIWTQRYCIRGGNCSI